LGVASSCRLSFIGMNLVLEAYRVVTSQPNYKVIKSDFKPNYTANIMPYKTKRLISLCGWPS
jgi:hypothetical protein